MLERKIVRPDGTEYMTVKHNREQGTIEFHNFGRRNLVVKFDDKINKQLLEFLHEVQFVKFCEGEKKWNEQLKLEPQRVEKIASYLPKTWHKHTLSLHKARAEQLAW